VREREEALSEKKGKHQEKRKSHERKKTKKEIREPTNHKTQPTIPTNQLKAFTGEGGWGLDWGKGRLRESKGKSSKTLISPEGEQCLFGTAAAIHRKKVLKGSTQKKLVEVKSWTFFQVSRGVLPGEASRQRKGRVKKKKRKERKGKKGKNRGKILPYHFPIY